MYWNYRLGASGAVAAGGLATTGFAAVWFAVAGGVLLTAGFVLLRIGSHRRSQWSD
jgi:hypothetical protein